ncbi:hypothetical protein CYLTODRAFT_457286 [Cylindrobasidium torrendii FP15055 ss-10]|uniref:Uncharacterized protein n=1 Tax=Cylindrobasidium torrendii FP15055 ss-10 TaxID=1314674 RepID=A0A0D7B4C2_9AGAR|nr:hypothetical protein CYLTODRAFT_457286 [Cylindrobasidium torrendii FP15055 ss-10]
MPESDDERFLFIPPGKNGYRWDDFKILCKDCPIPKDELPVYLANSMVSEKWIPPLLRLGWRIESTNNTFINFITLDDGKAKTVLAFGSNMLHEMLSDELIHKVIEAAKFEAEPMWWLDVKFWFWKAGRENPVQDDFMDLVRYGITMAPPE